MFDCLIVCQRWIPDKRQSVAEAAAGEAAAAFTASLQQQQQQQQPAGPA